MAIRFAAVVQPPRGLRQVRRPWEQDRRSAELERAADAGEPYHQGLATTVIFRHSSPLPSRLSSLPSPILSYGGRQQSLSQVRRRMPRWSVDIIRKRAERLGTIEAANEKEAIEKAAKEFDIPPERQNRIVVQRMSKNKNQRTVPSPVAPAISISTRIEL